MAAMRSQSASARAPSSVAAFHLALVPILLAVASLSAAGRYAESPVLLTAALVVAGVAWLHAIHLARRGAGDVRVVLAGALALRLLALGGTPAFTADPYRYLWEGELVSRGINPYAYAPDDESLQSLRSARPDLHARVEHSDVRAAYPPLTQAVGALAASATRGGGDRATADGVLALRVFFALCDLAVLWPLARMLERAGLPRPLIVAWGWSPLVALEFAGAGHFDSLGIALWLGALALLRHPAAPDGAAREPRSFEGLGRVLLGASILVKFLPAVALPWLARGVPRRIALGRIAAVAAVCAMAYTPFTMMRGGEHGVVGGLADYALRWESASIVYRWIEWPLARSFELDRSWTDPRRLGRIIAGLLWLACAVAIWFRVRDPWRASASAAAAFFLLSPTLHPWYLTWLVPFLALFPSTAWLCLCAAAPILYWPVPEWQRSGVWREPAWLWPAVFLPFLVLLALEFARGAKARRPASALTRRP